jgi:hypothetical protein
MRKEKMRDQARHAIELRRCSAFVEMLLLAGEAPNEFYEYCEATFIDFQPCGPSEEVCALAIAKLTWRQHHPIKSTPELEEMSIASKRFYYGEQAAEAFRKKIQKKAGESLKQGMDQEQPEFPEAYELDTEWDTQIDHAQSLMMMLKQMKKRAGLS